MPFVSSVLQSHLWNPQKESNIQLLSHFRMPVKQKTVNQTPDYPSFASSFPFSFHLFKECLPFVPGLIVYRYIFLFVQMIMAAMVRRYLSRFLDIL